MLLVVLITAILVAGASATYITYTTTFHEQTDRLRETAQTQARLFAAIAQFDNRYLADFPGGSNKATISQVQEALNNYRGYGDSVEFTLGKREGDKIVFLLSHRHHGMQAPGPVAFHSKLAEPMRRALLGHSGTVVGLDYQGVQVLAAYEPVKTLGYGVVVKMDLAEIRSPFLRAFGIAIIIGTLVLGIGVWLFLRITKPWIYAIEAAEGRYQGIFDQAAVGIARVAPEGTWLEVNQRLCDIVGYTKEAILKLSFQDITHPEDLDEDLAYVRQLLSNERQTYSMEKRYIHSSGNIIWINLTVSLVRDSQGTPLYFISVVEDISKRKQMEFNLNKALSFRKSILNSLPDLIWLKDENGVYLACNPVFERLFGAKEAQIIGKTDYDFVDPQLADAFRSNDQAAIRAGKPTSNEEWISFKDDGHWALLLTTKTPMFDDENQLVGVLGIAHDITSRKINQELTHLRQQLAELVYTSDRDHLMRRALDTAEQLTNSKIGFFHFVEEDRENISLQVWSTRTLSEMCSAQGDGLHYPISEAGVWVDCIHQRRPVIHNDYASLPHKQGLPNGHAELVRELTVPIFREGKIVAVIGVGNKDNAYTSVDQEVVSRIADLTYDYVERKNAEEQIEYMAFNDVLTGLPNRQLLSDRLRQAISLSNRSAKMLAICYLDLDDFKPVNDRYGHHCGDTLLIQLGKRLQVGMREGDTLARLGGDEFIILLNNLSDVSECEEIIKRILQAISQPFEIELQRIHVSGSIGATLYPLDDADADTLIRHADQAMYKAKIDGKAEYKLYNPIQNHKILTHRQALQNFDAALANRELVLHFQPRIDLNSGKVVSAEALVRWQHPEQGLLLPGKFLNLIAGTPQETVLGEWVLRTALDQHVAWREQGIELPISVNISPRHIQQPGFAKFLSGLLAEYSEGISGQLELEILENAAIGDTAQVADIMYECAELGVLFSLDDFGTGYSSLTYFHRLPINVLKIDQNFVRNMLDDVQDLEIVEGVIRLAQTLHTPVVAEGVESMELSMLLQRLGCQYVQGYGIARPMPVAQITQWLGVWKDNGQWHRLPSEPEVDTDRFDIEVFIFNHRRWFDNMLKTMQSDNRTELPSLDENHCLMGRWLNGIGKARYGRQKSFAFIAPKHHQLHLSANRLVANLDDMTPAEVESQITLLQQNNQELIDLLLSLTNS